MYCPHPNNITTKNPLSKMATEGALFRGCFSLKGAKDISTP